MQIKRNYSQLIIWSLSLAVVLGGCGGGTISGDSFDGKVYSVVNAGTLTFSTTEITGTGSLVFASPLTATENSFRPSFTLQDGGKLKLTLYGSNTLTTGISVEFSRNGSVLSVSLKTDSQNQDVSSKFTGIDASTTMTFQVDAHNGESPAHILIWDSSITNFAEDNALLNSEDSGFNAPGKGTGTFWGLTLESATVTAVTLGAAKFED